MKFLLQILILSIVFGQVLVFNIGSARIILTDFLACVVVFLWFLKKIIKKENFKVDFLGALILIFIFFVFISFLNSFRYFELSDLKTGFFYFFRLFIYLCLYFVFFDAVNEKFIKKYLYIFLFSSFLIAVAGFFQFVFIPDFSFMQERGFDPHVGRLLSTFFDPNLVSLIFVFGSIVAIILLLEKNIESKNKQEKIRFFFKKTFFLIIFIIFLIALGLTYSRSGLLAFLGTMIFLGFLKSPKILGIIFIASVLVFFIFPSFSDKILSRFSFNETAAMRFESWKNALIVIKERPFLGIGYNNLPLIQGVGGEEFHSKSGFDSSFLTIWATVGLFGFLTIIAIFIKGFLSSLSFLKNKKNRVIGFIVLGILVGFLIHSQFVNSLLYPHLAVIFWSFLGIVGNRMNYNYKKQ